MEFMNTKWTQVIAMLSLALGAQLLSFHAEAQAPELGDILRDANGRIRHMNQTDAKQACRAQRARLPSARELGEYSQSLGACGVLSVSEFENFQDNGNCHKRLYDRIRVDAGEDEPADEFYFNFSGYQRPAGELGDFRFWTSSAFHSAIAYGIVLSGSNGGISYARPSFHERAFAVRCVR